LQLAFQNEYVSSFSAKGSIRSLKKEGFVPMENGFLRRSITLATMAALSISCAHRQLAQKDASGQETYPNRAPAGLGQKPTPVDEVRIHDATQEAKRNSEATATYHFSMAQAYSAEGNPDRAIEEYKLTLMFDRHAPLVYARLATEYIKKGMLSAAMETCKEALQLDPKYTDARLILAGLYSSSRQSAEALAEYTQILKDDPTHEEAIMYQAQVLMDDGKVSLAHQNLKTFVKKNPESALAWYYLGRVEQKLGQYKASASAFKKSVELRPSFTQASLSLGYLHEENQAAAEAIVVYKEIYDQTQDPVAANRLATLYLKAEKYRDAIPYLEAIQAGDPDDMNVRVKLGLVQMELKNYPKAVEIFQQIVQKNPDSDRIHYYLGSIYEETRQFEDAIRELSLIPAESKLFGEAALHVGYLFKQLGKIVEAQKFIGQAIAKSPKHPSFYLFQASLHEEAKSVDQAVSVMEGAFKIFPEDERVLYYLGSLYDRQGQVDKGLEKMETLLRVNPKNVDALNYIGYTWTQQGVRLNDAEKLLRQAVALKPNNAYIQDSWGWHLFVRGKVSQAIVELEKAAKLKPSEPTILDHLADAYARANLREKALKQYEEALRHAEEDESRQKIAAKLENLRQELVKSNRIKPAGGYSSGERIPASGK
jgi:tetratricopeptide (TPR) repeat protein